MLYVCRMLVYCKVKKEGVWCDNNNINQSTPRQISMVVSYTTVGITDYINFRNMNKAYIGLISAPFYFALSKNAFIVVEWLHGWIVTYG